MKKSAGFSKYHPIINFVFYAGAFVFGMFLIHPAFLAVSLVSSAAYLISLKGGKGGKTVFGFLPLICLLSLLNSLINTQGNMVLFYCPWGNPYTLEALFYGMALSAMVVSVLLWFASYQEVMTSDKFLYLFGVLVPSAALVLTMVLRLVPNFHKKTEQVRGARKGVGMFQDEGDLRQRILQGMDILSSMVSWALEGGIVMADSMKSRGYGCGKRTNFSLYRFEGKDKRLLAWMTVLIAGTLLCVLKGGAAAAYTPELSLSGAGNGWTILGVVFYFLFLSLPTVINVSEDMLWHILRSKI